MLSIVSRNRGAIRAKSQFKAIQSITVRSFSIVGTTSTNQNKYTKDPKDRTFPTLINTNRSFSTAPSQFLQFTNLVELQIKSCEKFQERPCFGSRSEKGDKYDWITYQEFGRRVQKFRNVLSHHKIGPGDKVAIISNNRVEWAVAFYAVTGYLLPYLLTYSFIYFLTFLLTYSQSSSLPYSYSQSYLLLPLILHH